jgi:hypothetical protein
MSQHRSVTVYATGPKSVEHRFGNGHDRTVIEKYVDVVLRSE